MKATARSYAPTVRLFLAVPIPPDVAAAAFALLPPPVAALRRVRPELMHLTLAFLGDTPDPRLAEVIAGAEAAAAGQRAFEIVLDQAGRFPVSGVPRVVWLGVGAGRGPLQALADRVVTALRERALRFAARPFQPHLTLARIPERTPLPEARAIAAAVAGLRVRPLAVPVDRIVVVESVLFARGPRYRERGEARLSGGVSRTAPERPWTRSWRRDRR